ncbi:MAG: MFS transporter [Leptolyngbyaceae cyanobacterium T60_A2020_046]|nr:MFS transporter [Leptolyngbyaceae cyanobacterium T60_A2020_046]
MTIFATFSPALRKNLTLLFAAGLCFWAGLAGLLPTLPLFIETLGATGQQIGFVMASFAIGLLVMRPWLSRLADERGRKLVLVIGIAAIAIAPFLYLFASTLPPLTWQISLDSDRAMTVNGLLVLMMLFRAVHGISIAAFVVAYSALIIDISPPNQRGELIGYMSLVNPVGMALGPALGGYLLAWSNFVVAFLAMGLLGIVGLMFVSQVQETYQPTARSHPTEAKPLFWRLLWTPRVRTPALILLLVGLAFGTLSTFVPLFVREAGLALNVGLIYTASAIASFGIRLLVGRASDRHGRGRFITISLLLYTVAMGIFWQAQTPAFFLFAGLMQGAAGGMLIPMIAALMGDRSRPDERGKVFGLAMVGFDLGIALAGPIFGSLADWLSYRNTFGLAGAMTFLGFIIFVTASSKDLRHSLRFALSHGRDVYAVDQHLS